MPVIALHLKTQSMTNSTCAEVLLLICASTFRSYDAFATPNMSGFLFCFCIVQHYTIKHN